MNHSMSITIATSAGTITNSTLKTLQIAQSIIAHRREFKSSNGDTPHYIRYQGYGDPPPSIGQPGDIFVDMSPNTHRLFVRYHEWQEWYGVYRSTSYPTGGPSFQFQHPKDKSRTIWCSPTDVTWYKKNSFYRSRMRLFTLDAYAGRSFVPAHDLLSNSAILSLKSITGKQVGVRANDRLREQEIFVLNNEGAQIQQRRIVGPALITEIPLSDPVILASTSRYTQSDIQSVMQRQVSTSLHTLSHEQQANGYGVFSIHKRSFKSPYLNSPTKVIAYVQYRGLGTPSTNLGNQGDLFIDKSPNAYRVFVRYDDWLEWPGIYSTAGLAEDPHDGTFLHPEDPTHIVWCTDFDVTWFKATLIRNSKVQHFAAEPTNTSFISAHNLISRSIMRTQSPSKRILSGASGTGGDPQTKKRKISEKKSPSKYHAPRNGPSSLAELQVTTTPHHHLVAGQSAGPSPGPPVNTSNTPSSHFLSPHPSAGGIIDAPGCESRESSINPMDPSSENITIPTTSSDLESSPTSPPHSGTGITTPPPKNEPTEEILPANITEAVEGAEQAQRLKEIHRKRMGRYQSRRQELVQSELEVAAQEQQLLEAERQMKERLEAARQNALKRREENRHREEELRKEKEELVACEEEVFQWEQAIKRRKELVAKMENMIKRMDES
ncbi:hypothetical protein BDZ94DRAFT_1309838 [Collybia nuda]|uniref:Uncharacterized protein n=1 Tax=Collybia nuda TaxID=64659 RepID=A0A9P6CIU7_9AGAR|nr:hypothetical protein BDZ94DRAFT_1309838 [Collybia nuda]